MANNVFTPGNTYPYFSQEIQKFDFPIWKYMSIF